MLLGWQYRIFCLAAKSKTIFSHQNRYTVRAPTLGPMFSLKQTHFPHQRVQSNWVKPHIGLKPSNVSSEHWISLFLCFYPDSAKKNEWPAERKSRPHLTASKLCKGHPVAPPPPTFSVWALTPPRTTSYSQNAHVPNFTSPLSSSSEKNPSLRSVNVCLHTEGLQHINPKRWAIPHCVLGSLCQWGATSSISFKSLIWLKKSHCESAVRGRTLLHVGSTGWMTLLTNTLWFLQLHLHCSTQPPPPKTKPITAKNKPKVDKSINFFSLCRFQCMPETCYDPHQPSSLLLLLSFRIVYKFMEGICLISYQNDKKSRSQPTGAAPALDSWLCIACGWFVLLKTWCNG